MSILARFTATPSVTTEQYDESVRRLEESEANWPPDGMEYHIAFTSGGNFRVSEIWDTREQLEAFGQRLMPLLADIGIELAGDPEIIEVHNIVKRS
jgi:hypothetical protein